MATVLAGYKIRLVGHFSLFCHKERLFSLCRAAFSLDEHVKSQNFLGVCPQAPSLNLYVGPLMCCVCVCCVCVCVCARTEMQLLANKHKQAHQNHKNSPSLDPKN